MQNESIGMVIQSLGEGHGRGLLDNGFLALPLFAIMGVVLIIVTSAKKLK